MDDQTQERIRLETASVYSIFEGFASGQYTWLGSEAFFLEAGRAPDPARRDQLSTLRGKMAKIVEATEEVAARMLELVAIGFQAFDALHLASAELGEADLFLTTDDRLLRVAKRAGGKIRVRVENPLDWLSEVEES